MTKKRRNTQYPHHNPKPNPSQTKLLSKKNPSPLLYLSNKVNPFSRSQQRLPTLLHLHSPFRWPRHCSRIRTCSISSIIFDLIFRINLLSHSVKLCLNYLALTALYLELQFKWRFYCLPFQMSLFMLRICALNYTSVKVFFRLQLSFLKGSECFQR